MSIPRRLNELIAVQFKVPVETIRPDTDFYADLEADALDMPELAMEVEEVFDIMIDNKRVDALRTVRDLQEYVERILEEKRLFSASALAAAAYLLATRARHDTPDPIVVPYGDSHE